MTTVTENHYQKLEGKIDKLSDKLDKLTEMTTNLTIGQTELKAEIKGLDKRLENLEVFNRIVGGGVTVGILLALLNTYFSQGKLFS